MDQKPQSGPFYLGVDVGGTNVKAGVVDDRGESLSRVSVPTDAAKGPDIVLVPRRTPYS